MESDRDWTPPKDLNHFLNNGSPPIYVGFGSMGDLDPQITTEIVIAA